MSSSHWLKIRPKYDPQVLHRCIVHPLWPIKSFPSNYVKQHAPSNIMYGIDYLT